jgi:DHA3 family macrolide efflux protein-like MFS transporter
MDEKRALRQFFIIWSGQALSLLGSRLVQFALIWWLTKTTESATVLAMASLVGLLPQVVLGPFVGVLVDRWRRRWVMFGSDGLVALATLVLAVLFWQDAVQVWHVFVILFVRALAGSFHWPAMQASTTLMVPERLFTRIQGLNQTLQGGLNVAAAPLGALLLEVSTMHSILAIDIATALVAMLPLLFIAIPQPERKVEVAGQIASFWDELHDGLRYVRSHRGLRMLITMAVMVNLVLVPTFSLMPILVTNHFSGEAVQLAWMEALSGAGIVVGGALLGAWGGFRRKILTTQTGLLGMGLAVLVVGLTPSALFWLAVAAMFGVGLSMALTNGPILAILQMTVAPDLQGRVFTLLNSLVTLATPVGLIIAGPVADLLGVQMWFVAGGLVTALVGVFGFFSTALMSIEDGPAQAVVEQVVV